MTEKKLSELDKDKQPASLSEHYHKARKQLVLWSGILFAWELVGIDLGGLKESGGSVGPIVKALKSPQAVPWVFLILLSYFFYRTIIEWYQSDPSRRKMRASRVDMAVSLGCGILALTLYFIQRLLEVQIADKVSSPMALILGMFAPFFIWIQLKQFGVSSGPKSTFAACAVGFLVAFTPILIWEGIEKGFEPTLYTFLYGNVAGAIGATVILVVGRVGQKAQQTKRGID